ncbi:MAG: response regulator [Bacteroidetes bacterium]|jgi:signal transduction histidine kinase/ligand-binding sensor domain-containing protein/DNA-binding NarL/FixJ family response regulator|nr:response regulator [Bacteroidota bacterium]MBT3747455.1 response regulator [Bacteroidota bacterium]MBT4398823.1 response regulator [Bacteroidota bacterium]MBT4408451.1 response regulator [Bacteroidota bacterium]MBT7465791.1 response regulator [Bacteroidota bacterium]
MIWIILLGSCHAYAQLSDQSQAFYKFIRLNETDGLTNNVVNDIIQDDIGFIWIATDDGVFRYNGTDFQSYRNIPEDSNSIPSNAVQTLHLDQNGNIWALTDYGIGIYKHGSDSFDRIMPGNGPEDIPYRSVTSVATSHSGYDFIGTFGGGVVTMHDKVFSKLPGSIGWDRAEIGDQEVMELFLDKDSVLWIGTWNDGLLFYDLKYNDYRTFNPGSPYPQRIYSIVQMADNSIWVGTNKGLWVFDNSLAYPLQFSKESHDWFPDNEILAIYEDNDGIIWIGSRNSGLFSMSERQALAGNNLILNHFQPSIYEESVSDRTISKIFQDTIGNIWIGTHNSGLNVFKPKGEAIRQFSYRPDLNSINHQSVWGICEGSDSTLWIGTDGQGVSLLNPYTQKIRNISLDGFTDAAILSALKTSTGEIWFGTYSGGINILNPNSGSISSIGNSDGLQSLDIRVIFESSNGNIWIGTNGSGLHKIDLLSRKVSHIVETDYYDIRGIQEDQNGNLWLASFGNGLLCFNQKNKTIEEFNWFQNSDITPVAFSILYDNNDIWVGTRQRGLLRFDVKSKQFRSFSQAGLKTNNTVRAIVKDQMGNIWASTNLGLSCFLNAEDTIRSFDYTDGVQNGQFNDGSGLLMSTGDLAFGGKHGVNIFSPKDLLSTQRAPKVILTRAIIFSRTDASHDYKSWIPLFADMTNLELAYNQNTLSLEFTSISFPRVGSWTYQYWMEGVDNSWIDGKAFGSVTYRNLPAGDYQFKVRSVDRSGTINGQVEMLGIKISPPWWITWPAFIMYFLLFAGLTLLILHINNTRVKLKEKLIYEQKLRQQEQVAIQQKIRFFTNFSHELRSPLTLIQGPVNDLLNQVNVSHQKPLLQMIRRNSGILLKLVNRLLEFRKLETQKTNLNIAHNDLSVLLQEEIESFNYLSGQSGLEISYQGDHDIYAWVDIEKIHIILSNLLSNAMKYTPVGGLISIHLVQGPSGVTIQVKDTGQGIPDDELEAIFTPFYQANNSAGKGGTGIGLALTRSFVELHGGKISVDSDHSGSTFTIHLPNDLDWLKKQNYVRIIPTEPGSIPQSELIEDSELAATQDNPIVLIVDDNADIRDYIQKNLQKRYTVIACKDGLEALKEAENSLPDLIISDIMMPNLDGIELCQRLKESDRTNHIPVIILTAKDADEPKVEAYGAGADGYITKPFSSRLLTTRVENILNQRKALRQRFSAGNWNISLPETDSPDIRFIKNVESTILNLIEEDEVNVPVLARELGFSRTSLYRKIKSVTGFSINHFIRIVKLKHAAFLLINEDLTVSEVAFKLGFTDLKYFRNCFKDRYDILPSEYQKQNKRSEEEYDLT